jgi:hypothetical protein
MKYRITVETAIADLCGGAGYRRETRRYALRTRLSAIRRVMIGIRGLRCAYLSDAQRMIQSTKRSVLAAAQPIASTQACSMRACGAAYARAAERPH